MNCYCQGTSSTISIQRVQLVASINNQQVVNWVHTYLWSLIIMVPQTIVLIDDYYCHICYIEQVQLCDSWFNQGNSANFSRIFVIAKKIKELFTSTSNGIATSVRCVIVVLNAKLARLVTTHANKKATRNEEARQDCRFC